MPEAGLAPQIDLRRALPTAAGGATSQENGQRKGGENDGCRAEHSAECSACAGRAILASAMDDQITLRVPDLHCEGCVASIRSVLEHFPGVREVEGDLETSTLFVRYDLASITPLAIKTQLAAIGYPASAAEDA